MVHVSNLRKRYENHEALKGISFSIQKGQFYGLLGPNGAGKTTTISILSTLLLADEGEASIAGFDVRTQAEDCKKCIGVVPQEIALYEDMSAYENLLFWGGLYSVPKEELKKRIDTTLDLLGLSDRKKDKIKTYSGGMKRRINIASALLHKPQILFMDEPTVGIDPQSRNLIFEVIQQLHQEGMTIVYTTHYMEEAERFCDRIGIIDNGKIIAEGTLAELKHSCQVKECIAVSCTNTSDELFSKVTSFWSDVKRAGNQLQFYSSQVQNDMSKIILHCNAIGLEIEHIEIKGINLETIFLSLTGKQLRDG